jgi:hypothetical protein
MLVLVGFVFEPLGNLLVLVVGPYSRHDDSIRVRGTTLMTLDP